MARARPRRHALRKPRLRVCTILAWADDHHRRTGNWPTIQAGTVPAARDEKWANVHHALVRGFRGLRGGSSLARVLERHRGYRNRANLSRLTHRQILAWADAHRRHTEDWPTADSGPVAGAPAPGETWHQIDNALQRGHRGLHGGSSLAKLLQKRRGRRHPKNLPPLTEELILAWADAHYRSTGKWPTQTAGPVARVPGESWHAIQLALMNGYRGLRGGDGLAKLLADGRGVRNPADVPRLTQKQLLSWADAHRRRTGDWPTRTSGEVVDAPGEEWRNIDTALYQGLRGLQGGSSLARLLEKRRGRRNPQNAPPLRDKLVLKWADAHYKRTGRWPAQHSGRVVASRRESWSNIHNAFVMGYRGRPGGDTLARLLDRHRRKRHGARRESRSLWPTA